MNKKIILIITIIIVFIGIGLYFTLNQSKLSSLQMITNFEECVQAGYSVGESHPRLCWTSDNRLFIEEVEYIEPDPPSFFGPITISGEITCLPKIGTGPQTMECAIGMKGNDGQYYGLKNLFEIGEYKFSQVGLQIEVFGMLSIENMLGPDGNRYDIVGVIDVTSIKEINNKNTQP